MRSFNVYCIYQGVTVEMGMTVSERIRCELHSFSDNKYRDFTSSLIPTVKKERFIGVRVPELRRMAKKFASDPHIHEFLDTLPHLYIEEDYLHAFIICGVRDFSLAVELLLEFLPYVDNWAVCDSLRPVSFGRSKDELLPYINTWLASGEPYSVRFGIEMLMVHYLDEDFRPEFFDTVSAIRSDDYYVKMMVAWYFATALAKRYDDAIGYIRSGALDAFTRNKAIQKAIDSYRVTNEQKRQLRGYKIKEKKEWQEH